jgi:hypothetical protein
VWKNFSSFLFLFGFEEWIVPFGAFTVKGTACGPDGRDNAITRNLYSVTSPTGQFLDLEI